MHPEIGKINWVYFREDADNFDKSLSGLIEIFRHHCGLCSAAYGNIRKSPGVGAK
jgi:hypothetical protein